MERNRERGDEGFTLVELLIVVVILGMLATVVVFAVGGITQDGADAAAANDQRILINASEAYWAQNGAYANEAGLVSAGLLRGESELFDIVVAADQASYTVDPVATP